jgi:hypothetical protein
VEKAAVLTLRVTNTIHDAWTYNRDRESFKPQYTTTFAGMFVDYFAGGDYIRRVALGFGIMNPKRQTPRPRWGAARKPDRFITLGDFVHRGREAVFTIDLSRWAPPDWNGRCWLSAGVGNLYPGRGVTVEVLEAASSPRGKTILAGRDIATLCRRRVYRIHRVGAAPVLDGRLDDPAWKKAEPASGVHILGRAAVGVPDTRAMIVYDDRRLYIAFDCPEPSRPLSVSAEKLWGRDAVDVALNPSGDRRTFLQIIVDAAGNFDQFGHRPDGRSFRWKGVRAASARRADGWSAEISVPLAAMGLEPRPGRRWAGNFVRYRASDPMTSWSFMPGPAINDPERMAEFILEPGDRKTEERQPP